MLYDLAVIGAGAAGMRAAMGASDMGLAVLLADKYEPGGAAVFSGYAAVNGLLESALGGAGAGHARFAAAQEAASGLLSQTMGHHLRSRQVEYIRAVASVDKQTDGDIKLLAGCEEYRAKKLLLAVGSVASVPHFGGADAARADGVIHTERTLISIARMPERVLVEGGTLRSLQLALYACLCGARVIVINTGAETAPELDAEIAEILRSALSETGIEFILNAKLNSYLNGVFTLDTAEESRKVEAGMLLCGGTRRPATRGLGLKSLGILEGNGAVKTDSTGRTDAPGIYAAGECCAGQNGVAGTISSAETCVRSICGIKHPPVKPPAYHSMKYWGEAFSVGETLDGARGKRIRAAESKLPLPWRGRPSGMVKLVADAASRRLLGAHLIGDGAYEISREFAAAIQSGMKVGDIRLSLFTPSAEITGEALHRLQKSF